MRQEERGKQAVRNATGTKKGHTRRKGRLRLTLKNTKSQQGRVIAMSHRHRTHLTIKTDGYQAPSSARLVEVCLRFGVPLSSAGRTIASDLTCELGTGTITLITGPSGSGKSLMLAEIARQFPTSRWVNNTPFPLDVSVLDAIAPTRPVYEALGTLTACGLGEPMLWIRRFNQLSDGEQYRARLARALSLHQQQGNKAPLLCDEFGSILHRRIAKAMAFNLRKLVTREGISLVVAISADDLERDLQPDQVIRLGRPEPIVEKSTANLANQPAKHRAISFIRQLRIERGKLRDYECFAPMHYRTRDQIGFVDKVFVLRHGASGDPVGVVIYGHPALELALRNRVTGGRFVRNGKRLNREMRVLKRLVIHPDIRGCGLGHWLVERTLPLAGVRFVECLAAMGAVNPVFDKAGMLRIGTVAPPPSSKTTLDKLRATGADPLAADFVTQVCRRPTVRRLVADCVFDWYRTTTGGGEQRVAKQSPRTLAQTYRQLAGSRPVYFIWARDERDQKLIDKNIAKEIENEK